MSVSNYRINCNSFSLKNVGEGKMKEYEIRFKEAMEQLAKKHERSKVYVDFMDYYIYKNSKSLDAVKPHGYHGEEYKHFEDAYSSFNSLMQELIKEHGWYDYIGEYYEEYVLAGSKASAKGQFYTPRAISDVLSKIVGFETSMSEAYDPACGSARNLLDYHSKHPDVRCTGEDLDESACKMAVINFHIHGVNGVVHWIDALTREYMGTSWRILKDKIYVTDIDTIRANEEIITGVTLLSLSDETLKQLITTIAKNIPQSDEVTTETKEGLDTWLK